MKAKVIILGSHFNALSMVQVVGCKSVMNLFYFLGRALSRAFD
jgi:hypothetical protein